MAIVLKHAWVFMLEPISINFFEKTHDKSLFSILVSDSGSSEDLLNFWSFRHLVDPLKGVIIS